MTSLPRGGATPLALPEGVDTRELLVDRIKALEAELAHTRSWLDSALPIDSSALERLRIRVERTRVAWAGLDGRRGGAQREWVLDILDVLGRLLKLPSEDDAWLAWLELQSASGDPDGPLLEVTVALVDNAAREPALAAARAWVTYMDEDRRPRRHSGATALYAALRALFRVLFPGVVETDEPLRKLVGRARKRM
jgi:hypothetical protein